MVDKSSVDANNRLVAIGASAGGLNALLVVLSALPADLTAAVMVVQHLDPKYPSHMAEILARQSQIRIIEAVDGDVIEASTVYFAPPGKHLLVGERRISLTTSELVHFVRPSVDLLLESVAATYGEGAIGVILTGSGLDGALGIRAIKEKGGLTISQDPLTAESSGMPNTAIATGAVDFILPLDQIAGAIVRSLSSEE